MVKPKISNEYVNVEVFRAGKVLREKGDLVLVQWLNREPESWVPKANLSKVDLK